MPADYSSTARALALPVSPLNSPSPDPNSRPPWVRTHSTSSRRGNRFAVVNDELSYKDQAIAAFTNVYNKIMVTFKKMTLLQRVFAVTAFVILNVLGILFLVYNERIFGWLAPGAKKWREVRGGWMVLWSLTFISAMPPLIGYSTTVTIAGFVYGFPNGWYIVASSTVIGSFASFMASRTVLSKYVHRLVGNDKRFEALALTLQHDGLKILCMIRFCPLPYSLTNAAMSTFPTVRPLSYALATAISTPKLLIHVFIGSRLAQIAEKGGKMDASTKAINYASIIFGAVLGASVGWIIYQRTIARARELEIEEQERLEAEGANVYADEERPDETMNEDDISLWDNDEQVYRDDFTDDDENPFAKGDDEEANIGSNSRPKKSDDADS